MGEDCPGSKSTVDSIPVFYAETFPLHQRVECSEHGNVFTHLLAKPLTSGLFLWADVYKLTRLLQTH